MSYGDLAANLATGAVVVGLLSVVLWMFKKPGHRSGDGGDGGGGFWDSGSSDSSSGGDSGGGGDGGGGGGD